MPMAGEMFVLSRRGLAFTASSGSRKFQAGGQLFLSPLRIVFVARDLPSRGGGFPRADPSPLRAAQAEESSGSGLLGTLFGASKANVLAFDLPLATLERESFNQPIFGANNLTGVSPPLPGSACDGADIHWCLSFQDGGVGTFLPIFFGLLAEMRSRLEAERSGAAGAAAGGSTEVPTAFAVAVPETAVAEVVRAAYVDPSDPTKLYVEAAGPRARRGGHSFRE